MAEKKQDEKLDAYLALLEKSGKSPAIAPYRGALTKLRESFARPYFIEPNDPADLSLRVLPEDALPAADEIQRLEQVAEILSKLSGAAKEALDQAEANLYTIMSTKGPSGFTHNGKSYAMSHQSYAQAIKEVGGTGNPDLKQWLIDNGAPDVAEGTINATTLKGTVGSWLKDHPIEMTVPDGDDVRELSGQELLDALGFDNYYATDPETGEPILDEHGNPKVVTQQEQLDARIREHERLATMVKVWREPKLSVTTKK